MIPVDICTLVMTAPFFTATTAISGIFAKKFLPILVKNTRICRRRYGDDGTISQHTQIAVRAEKSARSEITV